MKAPAPANESQRLAALRAYHILDTGAEQVYDDVTALAAYICEAPIAMISLVDETRQWFKSKVGLTQNETPRDVAFCAHAILQTEPLIVRDATKDDRFSGSSLVTGEPYIRFYAGFRLISPDGFALGTLCAVDRRSRQLSDQQRETMVALSRQVMVLLEHRRVSGRLAHLLEQVKVLSGLLPICAWCKRIRNDEGYWKSVETFIQEHTEADFTHGICPDCLAKAFPGNRASAGSSESAV